MNYVKSNIEFPYRARHLTREQAEMLTVAQFDEMNIADATALFNEHRDIYDRLTADTDTPIVTDTAPQAQESADQGFNRQFADIVDRAIENAFHGHER